MKAAVCKELRERVDVLERSLLALTSLNDMNMEMLNNAHSHMAELEPSARLLDYLLEPIMFQIEALRVLIHQLEPAIDIEDPDKEQGAK